MDVTRDVTGIHLAFCRLCTSFLLPRHSTHSILRPHLLSFEMGNDGGSIPDRRDLVRNKPKAEQADKANQTRARWFFCALSKVCSFLPLRFWRHRGHTHNWTKP